jgi:hypothetical protein
LSSCVTRSRLIEANKTIDSLKNENALLIAENEELLNGEERLVKLYNMNVSKGNYLSAEENYNNFVKYHPASILIKELEKSINDVSNKAQSQRDSIDKIIRDSIRLANIDELGEWKIGDYVNDFNEPTGEHYVYQRIHGRFSNSATANGDLLVKIVIHKGYSRYALKDIDIDVNYDEYCNGTIDEKGFGNWRQYDAIRIVCHDTKKVYVNDQSFRDLHENGTDNYFLMLDILKQNNKIDFKVRGDYKTVYYYTIDTKYLENALLKAGIETL